MAIPVLVLEFWTAEGKQFSLKYPYIDTDITEEEVSELMDKFITSKAIFKTPPASKVAAKIVVETETPVYDATTSA